MGDPRLTEAREKVARALTHLEELDDKVRAFVDAHPYALIPDGDLDSRDFNVYVRALSGEEPVPASIGVVLGDALHNLRAALNYVAWQLALMSPSGPKEGRTGFPIYDDPTEYQAKAPTRELVGILPDHQALIERCQPYHGGHRSILHVVGSLNNVDKHRLIPAITWSGLFRPPTWTGDVRSFKITYT